MEVAIVAPVLALLVAGIGDLGRGLSAKFALNQAVQRALEKAAVSNRRTDYTHLKAETANAAGIPLSSVAVETWLECDGTRQSNFNGSCTAGRQTARYVKVGATAPFAPMFSYGFLEVGPHGTMALQADAAIRVQ